MLDIITLLENVIEYFRIYWYFTKNLKVSNTTIVVLLGLVRFKRLV